MSRHIIVSNRKEWWWLGGKSAFFPYEANLDGNHTLSAVRCVLTRKKQLTQVIRATRMLACDKNAVMRKQWGGIVYAFSSSTTLLLLLCGQKEVFKCDDDR